jgi:glycosyltransferase involved in cell wall biosynthesis
MSRPVLTVIQSTHVSLEGFESVGLLERHRQLLQAYAREFEVHVYSSDGKDYSSIIGVRHHPGPGGPRWFFLRHFFFYLWLITKAPGMKGVIKVFGSSIPTLILVRALSRCPMMVTYQWDYARQTQLNEGRRWKGRLAPLMERLSLRPADLVLVTTPWLEERVRALYKKETVLLPNWVDFKRIEEIARAWDREDNLILFAGRLHWSKGVDRLLDAYASVVRSHPQARLMICGEGEKRRELEAQRDARGLGGAEFVGKIPQTEVLEWMCRASVVVLPTLTMEGHAKSLIEAMACGAACVVSDVPGNSELIRQETDGLLVSPGDVEAMADGIGRLLDDPALRRRLGEEAGRAAAGFAFAAVVPREMAVLHSLHTGSLRPRAIEG